MQNLHLLPSIASESTKVATFSPFIKKKGLYEQDREVLGSIVLHDEHGLKRRRLKQVKQIKLCCKSLNLFQGKDIPKAWPYHTLHLKRLASFHRRQNSVHSMMSKSEETVRGFSVVTHMPDSATTCVGSKILPITDITQSSTAQNFDYQCSNGCTKEKVNEAGKSKAISRMKELLKWAAAAAKAEKGGKYIGRKVMNLRNKSGLRKVPDYDQLSNESPKISFRWDMDRFSTTSSVYSAFSGAISSTYSMRLKDQVLASAAASVNSTPLHVRSRSRRGNWITTDSEFVVLEL